MTRSQLSVRGRTFDRANDENVHGCCRATQPKPELFPDGRREHGDIRTDCDAPWNIHAFWRKVQVHGPHASEFRFVNSQRLKLQIICTSEDFTRGPALPNTHGKLTLSWLIPGRQPSSTVFW